MTARDNHELFFSIIIPTFNRPGQIASCLQCITRLKYPKTRYEVIVVDDGSIADLSFLSAEYEGQINLKLLRQNNSGPAAARNHGARHAQGAYIAFMDDDCRPCQSWLSACEAQIEKHPYALIGGTTMNLLTGNIYALASQQIVDFLYGYFQSCNSPMQFFTSNNMVIPARLFHGMGGFNTAFPLAAAEDRELCSRWLFSGGFLAYAQDMVMGHAHHLILTSYLRQHFNYGRGGFIFNRIEKQRSGRPLQIAPVRFYTGLLTSPFKKGGSGLRNTVESALIILSQAANCLGFFHERYRQRKQR